MSYTFFHRIKRISILVSVSETNLIFLQGSSHRKPSKKRILNQLQSEVKALKETFLRAADIVEEMGIAMETLDEIDDISTNSTFTSQSTLQRNRRSLQLNMTDLGVQETPLVKSLAEKMRGMPITNVRRIRSGVKSIFKYNALKEYNMNASCLLLFK